MLTGALMVLPGWAVFGIPDVLASEGNAKGTHTAARVALPVPRASRTITCGDDPVPVQFLKGQAVFFEWPKGELSFQAMTGNDQQWSIGSRDMDPKNPPSPTRFEAVTAEARGARTVMNLLSNTQHRCVIAAEEITKQGGSYDTTIKIAPEAESTESDGAVPFSRVKWVPAEEVKEDRERAEKAEKALADAKAGIQTQIDRGLEEYKAKYPETVHHDYDYDPAAAKEWGVLGVWHDCCRTFVEGAFDRDLPIPYSTREGKPHPLTNGRFDKGKYVFPEVISKFYLVRSGKGKKNELHFTENRAREGANQ